MNLFENNENKIYEEFKWKRPTFNACGGLHWIFIKWSILFFRHQTVLNQSKSTVTNNLPIFFFLLTPNFFLPLFYVTPSSFVCVHFLEAISDDCEGGNIILTHVRLMSYMTFELTLCLMKWNFWCHTHTNLLQTPSIMEHTCCTTLIIRRWSYNG